MSPPSIQMGITAPNPSLKSAMTRTESTASIEDTASIDILPEGSLRQHGAEQKEGEEDLLLEWRVEDYTVKSRGGLGPPVRILHDIAGMTRGGELTAILGPSGSGKTSFLECLSMRTRGFEGAIHVNGSPIRGDYYELVGFVHQHEVFFDHLTVREHLLFHAINRNGRTLSTHDCTALVDREMAQVDLTRCADTIIGGTGLYVTKGISGGERKRLAIATELLSQPDILLLDEPTSGLDSVMGELVCLVLRDLALRHGRVVLATLHTPSTAMWHAFTHALVFAGKLAGVAYHGPVGDIDRHFAALGHYRPTDTNPAEFLLTTVSSIKLRRRGEDGCQVHTTEANDDYRALCLAYKSQRDSSEGLPRHLPSDDTHKHVTRTFSRRSPLLTQMQQNLHRDLVNSLRQRSVTLVVGTASMVLGLLLGILYFDQALHSWRNPMSMLFALLIVMSMITVGHISLHLPTDWTIFVREYQAGANTLVPYLVSRCLSDLPRLLLIATMAVPPYFMMGLHDNQHPTNVLSYFVVMALLVMGAASVGYLGASVSKNPAVGIVLALTLLVPQFLFARLLYQPSQVPAGLSWIQHISVINHAYSAAMSLLCEDSSSRANASSCHFALSFLEVDPSELRGHMVQLAGLVVAYRLLALAVLAIRLRVAP